jgi:hypothetical protein
MRQSTRPDAKGRAITSGTRTGTLTSGGRAGATKRHPGRLVDGGHEAKRPKRRQGEAVSWSADR